jgi:acyl carrier protein
MSTPTTTQYTDEYEQLRAIITEVLELEPGELTDTSDFIDDHEADSLLAIEILARIERDMGVFIPQEDLPEMTNLGATFLIVARHAGWENDGA